MRHTCSLVAALLLFGGSLSAQSLFNSSGIGLPVDPLDARARALGNLGLGLRGNTSLQPSDPGAVAGLGAAAGVVTAQPSWVRFERADGSESGDFQGQRFPLVAFAYPMSGHGTATVSFGSYLDQRYSAVRDVTVPLGTGTGDATDTFVQDGGVAVVRLGFARRITPRVGAGLNVGRYTGSVRRSLVRELGDVDVIGDPGSYQSAGRWSYSGTQVTGGVAADVGGVARIAASATWSGALSADADETTGVASRTFDMPLQLRLGGSALLAPGLLVTASLARADWSVVSDDLTGGATASASLEYGVGMELSSARLLGAPAPLRIGYRRSTLPFDAGGGAPTESAFSGGLGLGLGGGTGFTLAGFDLALERGERSNSRVTESFWRATVSMRVAGF